MVWKVLVVILIILVIAFIVLYIIGRRMQKKQAEGEAQLEAMKQITSMLIIDKKLLRVKQSGLPQAAIDQVPWYMKRSKMPIIKAKVGPRIMTFCADRDVWDVMPVKSEVKVEVSGIYITAIKSVRGGSVKPVVKRKGIRGLLDRLRGKTNEYSSQVQNAKNAKNAKSTGNGKDSKSNKKKKK